MFDAGALIFTIKAAGAQVFQQEMRQADQAFEKTGRSAAASAKQVDQQGIATDATAKKSRAAKQPLDEQARATEHAGEEARKAKAKQEKQAAASEKQASAARSLSVALLAAGVAVTALVGLSVAKFASFDQAMSQTAAATMATAADQERLGAAALQAGADTAYSANEAAAAQEELAKAGLSVDNIIGGSLNASLALAAAGQLEVARSATIMATTLKQFKLPASDAAHVSDLLAAGAGKAQGSVDDLALALQYVGPVAAGLDLSLEETAGTLALFAEQGQLGERAGTGLRGVLMALTAPSQIAAKTMKEYGVEIFDGQGKMKSLALVSEELKGAFGKLSEEERSAALGRIFGNEQITAARVLYEGGAAAVEKWTEAVDDSGFAAEQAAMRQDNLAGDIEKLGGSLDTALIKTGSGANDVLRDMVQLVTGLIDWYGELDPAVQGIALTLGIATGAMLLFSGGALGAIGKFAELKKNLDGTNLTMGKTALIAAGTGLALTAVLTIVAMLASQHAEARAKAEAYSDTLEEGTAKVTKSTREMVVTNLQAKQSLNLLGLEVDAIQFDSAADSAEKLGISVTDLTDAAMGNVEALERVADVTRLRNRTDEEAIAVREKLGLKEGEFASAIDAVVNGVRGESASMEEAIRLAEQKNEVTEEGVPITESAAGAYLEAAEGAGELKSQLEELVSLIMEANGIGQDAISANIDYANAMADVDEAIRKATEGLDENQDGIADYILTLDQSTQAGRDNLGMLNDMAAKSQEAADKQFALDGNTANYKATLDAGRQALYDRALALTGNADAAGALADQIYRIPSDTEWEVIAETATASAKIDAFVRTYDGKKITMQLSTNHVVVGDRVFGGLRNEADGGHVKFFANGGGTTENHIAQFARAGTYRVWAEDETKGEWYLPDAPEKRPRSVAIAQQMLDGWGFDMVPRAGVQSFANGGGNGTDKTPGAAAWLFRDLIVQTPPNEDPIIISRGIVRTFAERIAGIRR